MTEGGFHGNYRVSTPGADSSMWSSSLGSMSALNSFSSRGSTPLYRHRDRGSFSFWNEKRNEKMDRSSLLTERSNLVDWLVYNLYLSIDKSIDRCSSKVKDIVQYEEWNRLTWIGLNMQSLESWSAAEVNVEDDLEVGIVVMNCTVIIDQWYNGNEETQGVSEFGFDWRFLCCCFLFHLMKIWDYGCVELLLLTAYYCLYEALFELDRFSASLSRESSNFNRV